MPVMSVSKIVVVAATMAAATIHAQGVTIARAVDRVDRSVCATVSLARDVAMECGVVRIMHPLPTTMTRTRARTPVLIYNSQLARPMPVVQADITLPGGSLPTTVTGTIYVDGSPCGSESWSGSDWGSPGNVRRVALWVDECDLSWETTLFTVTVQAVLTGGPGGSYSSAPTKMAIVSRTQAQFGAGWWVAGAERLVIYHPDTLQWIGGEGSTRIYAKSGSVYRAPNYDRPDSLTRTIVGSDTTYIRWAPQKLQVKFNYAGQQISTTNRLGEVTTFVWGATWKGGRLLSITLPVNGGSAPVYTFLYDSLDLLKSIVSPGGDTTKISRNRAQILAIKDPGGDSVSFTYASDYNAYRIDSRTDRRGFATSFTYDDVNRLTQSQLALGGGSYITTHFQAAESRGVGSAALPVDSVYTMINGPRTDTTITKIWHNSYGAPRKIRDALGNEMRISYNSTWPALADTVVAPSGFTTRASYNSTTGLISSSTLVDPRGASTGNATTNYTWDTTWQLPTTIAPPVGDTVHMVYDASNGNLIRKQMGSTSARRDTLHYANGQLVKVVDALGRRADSIAYDTGLGNIRATVSPGGDSTRILTDAMGRDTLVIQPVAGTDTVIRERRRYDALGRTIASASAGVARPYALTLSGLAAQYSPPAMTRTDTMALDAEGNLTWKRSTASPYTDVNPEENLRYDGAGRLISRQLGSGPDSMVYDPAGNAVRLRHRSGKWIAQKFDALNRLVLRIVPPDTITQSASCFMWESGPLTNPCLLVFPYYPNVGTSLVVPADTIAFVYDADGNMTEANNRYARVVRSYYPAGWLKTDTLKIGGYTTPGVDTYVKGQRLTYDLNGRRDTLYWDLGAQKYAWHGYGPLSSVTDHGSNQYKFFFNLANDLDSLKLGTGSGNWEKWTYNANLLPFTRHGLVTDSLYYDRMGRIDSARTMSAFMGDQKHRVLYNGLSAVVANESTRSGGYSVEEFSADAFGNNVSRRSRASGGINDVEIVASFSVVGELSTETGYAGINPPDCNRRNYDFSQTFYSGGRLQNQGSTSTIPVGCVGENTVDQQVAMKQFFSADDKLMAVQRYSYRSSSVSDGSWEEYWYDALGRRIFTRARRDLNNKPSSSAYLCLGTNRCRSFYERTWWDGDQVLIQSRTADGTSDASNSGTVGNINGMGMDRPVAIDRGGTIRVIIYDWRGMAENSVLPNGTTDNLGTDFPARASGGTYFTPNYFGTEPTINTFAGSPVMNGQGTTGMLYRRNRYFDPGSGRFTQADPIGLAGGMNLYGFANGDPINFSDPFGLCPDPKNPRCAEGGGTFSVTAGFNAAFASLGLNVQAGVATNMSSGATMLYFQGGPSFGIGFGGGVQAGVQEGSLNDLVKSTMDGGGLSFGGGSGMGSFNIPVESTKWKPTGLTVGTAGFGAYMNFSWGGKGTSAVAPSDMLRTAVKAFQPQQPKCSANVCDK